MELTDFVSICVDSQSVQAVHNVQKVSVTEYLLLVQLKMIARKGTFAQPKEHVKINAFPLLVYKEVFAKKVSA